MFSDESHQLHESLQELYMKWWFSSQKHGFLALRQKLLALSSSRQTPVEEDNIERTYSPMNRDNFQSIVFLPNSNRGNFVYP